MDPSAGIRWEETLQAIRSNAERGAYFAGSADVGDYFRSILELVQQLAGANPARDSVRNPEYWYHASPILSAECALFAGKELKLLLTRRHDDKLWALPGGLVEVGEGPASAAMREVLEETGIRCKVSQLVGLYDSTAVGSETPYSVIHFVFLADWNENFDELRLSWEVDDISLFNDDQLPKLSPGQQPRIAAAISHKKNLTLKPHLI